jgi:serine/threonine-protein kinase
MSESLIGQTLGKYLLRQLLGEGGMGAVYRAYDQILKREVAVKIINLGNNGTDLRARFIREARTAAGLEHSHIVRVYDYGVERNINYIVMQNLTGGALSDRLRHAAEEARPRASLLDVAHLLEQLASALDYAHGQGVIHRDIKPQNVMFNNQGQAFIVDFGIAKLTGATHITLAGTAMGTPSYMSPEQWRTDDIVPASDQYALAVMTYQLIAGRLPFEADTPLRVMYKHLNDQATPLNIYRPDVSRDLLLVMDRALSKDPIQRFPNCTQFAQAFSNAVSGVASDQTDYFTFKMARMRSPGAPYTPTPNQPSHTTPTPDDGTSFPQPAPITPKSPAPGMLIGGVGMLAVIGILAVLLLSNRADPSASDLTLTAVNSTLVALVTGGPNSVPATATDVPTETITRSATSKAVVILPSDTPEPSRTPVPSATETATSKLTETPSPTASNTPTRTATPSHTATEIPSATSTFSPTNTASSTETPSATASNSPEPTTTVDTRAIAAATLSQKRTDMAATDAFETVIAGEFTALAAVERTETASAATETPSQTPTATVTSTATPTSTYTSTSTRTHTATASATSTRTPTATATATFSSTPTATFTASSTPTSTVTPFDTPDATLTLIAEATQSAVAVRVRVIQNTANLRIGPGTDYRVGESTSRDAIFDVRAQYTRQGYVWYLLELRDDETREWVVDSAWIRSDLVEILEEFTNIVIPTAASISATPRPVTAVPTQPAATSSPDATQAPIDNQPPQPQPPTPRPPG